MAGSSGQCDWKGFNRILCPRAFCLRCRCQLVWKGELPCGRARQPDAIGLQQEGELPLLLEAQQESLAALPAPNAAVPEEQAPGPLQGILRLGWGDGRAVSRRGAASRTNCIAANDATTGTIAPWRATSLCPREQVPELHPQASAAAIGGEQHRHALGAAAALGVGVAPEGRHGVEGGDESGGEGIRATGLLERLTHLGPQAVATGVVGGPGGRAVLVVEIRQVAQQLRLGFADELAV
jgi:hypothetical protein